MKQHDTQLLIVRQSCMKAAVEHLSNHNLNNKNTPEAVIELTEKFVDYVMNGIKIKLEIGEIK